MEYIEEYSRICPVCQKEIKYAQKRNLIHAIKKNRPCRKCSDTSLSRRTNLSIAGKICMKERVKNKNYIKNLSASQFKRYENKEERKKLSDAQLKRYSNKEEVLKTSSAIKIAMSTPEIRKRHLDGLFASSWLKVKTDKGQIEYIEKWNNLGFNFEINYQLKTELYLFYLDGYDKDRNIVIEYDTKYHRRQKEKDSIRQNKIIEILNPRRFYRYDVVNKKCINILN